MKKYLAIFGVMIALLIVIQFYSVKKVENIQKDNNEIIEVQMPIERGSDGE